MDLNNFKTKSQSEYANHKKIKPRLKKIKPKVLDEKFKDGHDRQFEKMDCLDCANCCKTTSPIFLQTDIDRLSKLLKMKSSVFISTYLHRDDEGDFVLQSSPCPFLGMITNVLYMNPGQKPAGNTPIQTGKICMEY
ncbi:YkgJ family cysteine cluster protein [Echinicola jeungdonensis]|uniref:YkgJ family cysteine cluster protein n=1 Tax=Echinicola jeungdonensis TaxID=709343 RepID=UPI00339059A4